MYCAYAAVGVRDDALNAQLGRALQKGLFPPFQRLRRDSSERPRVGCTRRRSVSRPCDASL